MHVTVCELSDNPVAFGREWQLLVAYAQERASDLILLPEMPCSPWLAHTKHVEHAVWQDSVNAHDRWLSQLDALAPAMVLGTRPVIRQQRRFNEGFFWDAMNGYRAVHAKYYLPDEPGFWEASWYERGPYDFSLVECRGVKIGFLICTEMWFTEHARAYAKQGIHILVCPRATPLSSAGKWIAGGRAAAVMAGAFCLSSNRRYHTDDLIEWGSNGWVIEPEEGEVLGLTSSEQPFLTLNINLVVADTAKETYPRYVLE